MIMDYNTKTITTCVDWDECKKIVFQGNEWAIIVLTSKWIKNSHHMRIQSLGKAESIEMITELITKEFPNFKEFTIKECTPTDE